MKLDNNWINRGLIPGVATLCLVFAVGIKGQVQTKTTTTASQGTQVVKVERGEVVTVKGNDLIVKMDDGSIRHFPNVPESVKITVDGKQLGIHDLVPGMKLQRTITTTTTPKTVTTIQTVTGKIWYIAAPNSVILTLDNGTNQQFKIPQDQKFNVEGKMVDAFALRKGMQISATKIVEVPIVTSTQKQSVTGTMSPSLPSSVADGALLIAEGEPTPTPADAGTPAAPVNPVPTTGSNLPWIGLIALLAVVLLGLRFLRQKPKG